MDGQAHLRKVQIGRRDGVDAEELGGLEDGDRVVVGPSDRIAEGVRLIARRTRRLPRSDMRTDVEVIVAVLSD